MLAKSLYTPQTRSGDYDSFLVTGTKFKNIDNPRQRRSRHHRPHPHQLGDIDGTYYNTAGTEIGWLLHKGKYYDVVDPGVTRADGLNDKSELVGRYGSGEFGGTGFKATYK